MTTLTTDALDQLIDRIATQGHSPRTTYRLQFSPNFTFRDAEALIPYLHCLGITDLYASPLQKAMPGSTHGYDVCDPTELNPELGSRADFDRLTTTLDDHGMKLLLDIVPNHMGIFGDCNRWWYDVLENGPSSAYAPYFDVDWSPVKPELAGKVLLPILEDQYGNVLDSGKLTLTFRDGGFEVRYADFGMPIAPGTYDAVLEPAIEPLIELQGAEHDDVLEAQSILNAIGHLPTRNSEDPAQHTIRQREKEVIKRRLATLHETSAAFRRVLDKTLSLLNGLPGDPHSFDRLDTLLRKQVYRLAFWRVAGEEINYRRFFDVNSMAAIRNELPEVFEATHEFILDLVAQRQVNGLRVDHPDGLWNPPGYFRMLQSAALVRRVLAAFASDDAPERADVEARVEAWLDAHCADGRRWPLYVVAEKILSESEPLPEDWAVSGTTGYDFMTQVNGLFVDQRNEAAFDQLYSRFIGQPIEFHELEYRSKRMIMRESLAGEIYSLAHQLERLAERKRHYRDFTLDVLRRAIQEIVACMRIYRTYITGPDAVSLRDQSFVEAAVQEAQRRNPRVSQSVFYFVRDCLLLRNLYEFDEPLREPLLRWVMRFQQVTGPVMAKSVEDTAFYVYNRLVSLNEVGGHPSTFGLSLDEFHARNVERLALWPLSMTSTSTHDTKRSEDVRARLNALSEMPEAWAEAIVEWHDLNARHIVALADGPGPDSNDEYLLYQSLVGVLTEADLADDDARAIFTERIQAYMAKATREAKVRTSWTHADLGYDKAVATFVANILDPLQSTEFLQSLTAFTRRIAFFGRLNSLSQTVLKILSPGVPDTYRGTEIWDFSLVDPDNRRPVDYETLVPRLAALDEAIATDISLVVEHLTNDLANDDAKLHVTRRTLAYRSAEGSLCGRGEYRPLVATGARAAHVCAFEWSADDERAVVVVPRLVVALTDGEERLPVGFDVWGDTQLPDLSGGNLRNIFTADRLADGQQAASLGAILSTFPVAVLISEKAYRRVYNRHRID